MAVASLPNDNYPPEAYAPDGTLWWRLKLTPGKQRRFGDEQKIAAYLACHVGKDGIFTMRSLRAALGEDTIPNDAEHLNRRLRNLRTRDKWDIPSAKDDGSLAHDEYRVRVIGWQPGTGVARPRNDTPSDAVRRRVFARDKSICQVCGAIGGEPYDDMPDKTVRLTLGHRVPGKRLDSRATVDELQSECSRCNETVRDELFDPVTLAEVMPTVRNLKRQEKAVLLSWLEAGRRTQERVEQVYADGRRLSADEQAELQRQLRIMVNGSEA
jgi:5-methylcytosine-specific restriction endonuclease McrA